MLRVAINGFGRIGRTTLKAGWGKKGFNVVAVNDLTDAETLAHLLKYDSVYRTWDHEVKAKKDKLIIDGREIQVFAQKDPKALPWKQMKIDVVLECTGFFTSEEGAGGHLTAGAKSVIISAPAKGGNVPTYMMGVNAGQLKGDKTRVINNASCTTNCIAPIARVMEDAFGVKKAMMTTIHAYTADQNLVDGPHKDLRRASSAAMNIVPTTTGAAIATTEALPSLKNHFDGLAIRVPVICGSLADFTFVLKRKTTVEEVNAALIKASKQADLKGILVVSHEPLVSTDVIGMSASAVVDAGLTNVVDGDLVKVVAWYDNEWGYSHRLVDLALELSKKL